MGIGDSIFLGKHSIRGTSCSSMVNTVLRVGCRQLLEVEAVPLRAISLAVGVLVPQVALSERTSALLTHHTPLIAATMSTTEEQKLPLAEGWAEARDLTRRTLTKMMTQICWSMTGETRCTIKMIDMIPTPPRIRITLPRIGISGTPIRIVEQVDQANNL